MEHVAQVQKRVGHKPHSHKQSQGLLLQTSSTDLKLKSASIAQSETPDSAAIDRTTSMFICEGQLHIGGLQHM